MADDPLERIRQQYGIQTPSVQQGRVESPALARLHASYGGVLQEGEEGSGPGILESIGNRTGRALQTVNRFVKPIFLPQEILFATLAGQADPETTIFERWRGIDWAKFIPGTVEAPEVTSGSELLSLFGVQDENVLKWGGLAAEIFVDPLLAGATLRWVGKGLKSAELMAFGTKLDRLSSVGGLYENIPSPTRDWVDKRVDVAMQAIRDNEGRFLGIPSELIRRGADLTLSRSTAARLRLGGISAREREIMGDPGRDVFVARELGTQKAKDVFEDAYERLVGANNTLFGEPPRNLFKKVMDSVLHGARAENEFMQLNQRMRDTLLKIGYDFADNNGFLFTRNVGVEGIDDVARRVVGPEKLEQATDSFARLQERVRKLAKDEGLGDNAADGLVSRFSKFVEQVSQADAMLGYHLSGYEHIQRKFTEAVLKAMGDDADINVAYGTWLEFMARAASDDVADATKIDFDELVSLVKNRGKFPPGMVGMVEVGKVNRATGEFRPSNQIGTPSRADTFAFKQPLLPGDTGRGRTVAEILEGEHTFSSLNITSYIKGLRNGHMRRAYGMFVDSDNFDRYIRTVKEGKIIPSNIIYESDFERVMGSEYAAEAASIRRYLDSVAGKDAGTGLQTVKQNLNDSGTGFVIRPGGGSSASPGTRGFVINKQNLARSVAEDLMSQGVGRREAAQRSRDAMLKLVESIQPELARKGGVLERLRDAAQRYEANSRPRAGTFGRKFFDARDELDQDTLEMLGEFMNPLVSLQESTAAARVRIPAQEFMRRAYKLAQEYGYISDSRISKNGVQFRHVADDESVYGAFAGKFIHPGLRQEIERVFASRGDKAVALQRMRALISGGYLASPNVVTTNALGGIVTAALVGVGPARLIPAMAETLRPLLKNNGKEYDVYQDLTQHIGVQETSTVTQNVADAFEKTRLREVGMGLTEVEKAMHGFRDFFEGQLRSPLGAWWAGLDGFQFVEKWLKTATFKTERDRLIREFGNNPDGIARATKEAAEMARIAVFDYSELPDLLKWARDYGIIMFPGFTYFMAGRTVNALMNRPGAFAMADRMSEAVTSANLDPEEKMVAYHAMPDWLKSEQGSVVRTYEGPDGNKRSIVIPMAQIIPTNTQFGSNFAESLGTVGIWKPFLEILSAFTFADGDAVFSRHFGGQVFSPDARGMQKVSQAGTYLYDTLAPSAVRKLYRPGDGGAEGVIPAIWRSALPVDNEFAQGVHTYNELNRNVPDRRLQEELISTLLRSTQTLSMGGPINSVRKQLDREKMQMQQAIGALTQRFRQAYSDGNREKAEEIRLQIIARRTEFTEKWKPIIEQYRTLQSSRI